jgi:tRNA threonylcarbamoyladenosine modification (KEOPS) complex Cgi121 subunit
MLLVKKLAPLSMFQQSKKKLSGYVGIGGIKLGSQWDNQNILIETIQSVEEDNVNIQIFNPDKIISPKHLYYAVYFAEQAFALSSNISKNKSIEFLIYASFQRQIKTAINTVGFLIDGKKHLDTAYIVIRGKSKTVVSSKYNEILAVLNATPIQEVTPVLSSQRITYFQNQYEISDFELENVLLCMGLPAESKISDQDEDTKLQAFMNIISEKMAQLLMESFKSN